MEMDLGIPYGSTTKRIRMNGPAQGSDRNGQSTDENLIGLSHRGILNIYILYMVQVHRYT